MLWRSCSNVMATSWQRRSPTLSQRQRPTSPQLSISTVPQSCDNVNHDVVTALSQRRCASWDKTPIECSRERCERVLQRRGHFYRYYEQISFCDKAAKSSLKSPTFDQKWLCNKLGVMKTWIFQFKNVEKTKCKVFKISSAFR